MLAEVLESELASSLLERCRFPERGTKVTCAVSGGADSLTLLVLAVAAGCEVVAVHVDHGIRRGSHAEADVVAGVAAAVGAGFRSEQVHVEPGPNLEARARRARYGVLPAEVLTGHTADDQAETVLLHLLRGAGVAGLSALVGSPQRPIVALRRAETEALCAALDLPVVHDPSNLDPVFRRNRVRHELLPLARDIAQRDLVPLLGRQAGLLAEVDSLLHDLAGDVDASSARELGGAPPAVARVAVRSWLRAQGVGEGYVVDAAAVERVLRVARGEVVATEVTGGVRVARSGGLLSVSLPGARMLDMAEDAAPQPPRASSTPPSAVQAELGEQIGGDDPHLGQVVVDIERLKARVAELGAEITADYQGRAPLLVGVLKGAFMFMADLARAIDLPVEFDFMAVSSYGNATKSSGVVRIVKDLDIDLTGRDVLIIEDIIDSGLTLAYLRKNLLARHPASVEVCALLVREGLQKTETELRYVGFTIPPAFVVGYGLDVAENYRSLPYIASYVEDDE